MARSASQGTVGSGKTSSQHPFTFVGFPVSSWTFAIRIWLAAILSLLVSFWLQLESPSSAMLTVAILAEPTRGQALEKAGFRLIATIIGVAASIAITGLFSQARDLILGAFALWLGICVYAAGLLDGNRAYAAVLSGYTVAFVAAQQIDNPQHVFEAGMARGAAIAVGIMSVAAVNDLLVAPDRHPQLAAQMAAIHRCLREYVKALICEDMTDVTAAAGILRDIVALRPELSSLAVESPSGSDRSAVGRTIAVALVAELQAARALKALSSVIDLEICKRMLVALERNSDMDALTPSIEIPPNADQAISGTATKTVEWALGEVLRRDAEVCRNLEALRLGLKPTRAWRTPLYLSCLGALESGIRSAIYFALTTTFLAWAGWPASSTALSLVAVVIGLGVTTPNPRLFTSMALVAAPVATVIVGLLEFVILDGVDAFPLLALGLAPFIIGAALLITSPNRIFSAQGKLNVIFITAILAPSNPPNYDPQGFLFASLFVFVATALLLAVQMLIPPVSDDRRRKWLMASARRELDRVLSDNPRRYEPEEAMFRDAVRIARLMALGGASLQGGASMKGLFYCFDQSAVIRICDAGLDRFEGGPLSNLAAGARAALIKRDARTTSVIAEALREAEPVGHSDSANVSAALMLASKMFLRKGPALTSMEHER